MPQSCQSPRARAFPLVSSARHLPRGHRLSGDRVTRRSTLGFWSHFAGLHRRFQANRSFCRGIVLVGPSGTVRPVSSLHEVHAHSFAVAEMRRHGNQLLPAMRFSILLSGFYFKEVIHALQSSVQWWT
jgi:hypothetical protein